MILKNNQNSFINFVQYCSPYILFLSVYTCLYIYTLTMPQSIIHNAHTIQSDLALFATFITTLFIFFSTYSQKLSLNKKMHVLITGASQYSVIYDIFAIIYIAVFNHLIAQINGIIVCTTLGLLYIPTTVLMPSIFIISFLLSIILRNFYISTIILLPIGYAIAASLRCNPGYIAATIISGTLCADHLIFYFQNNKINTVQQVIFSIKVIALPIIIPMIAHIVMNFQYICIPLSSNIYFYLKNSLQIHDYIALLPILILCITRLYLFDLIISLMIASCSAMIIKIIMHKIILIDSLTTIFAGFYSQSIIAKIIILHLSMIGLQNLIQYHQKKKENNETDNIFFNIIQYFMNQILITLKIADQKDLTEKKYNVIILEKPDQIIPFINYIITTTLQVILPYGAIILLTLHNYKCSYFNIISYMIYPITTLIISLCLKIYHDQCTPNKSII